ncbi:MAG: phosphoribosylformylglycinamidine synthetase, partial [Firmicutes bacterium]|nr:phosphoribosylformylglycinamidine synthetase [Bacillota bacterium]
FMEKLLLEACLELFESDAVVGIQDMGAAGLISSACEMAARGDVGLEMDVRKVPAREENMQAWEFLLSESQERMLVCVAKGREPEVEAIFDKWGLLSAVIGHVTDDGMLRVMDGDEVVAEAPAHALADEAPLYHPASQEPAYLAKLRAFDFSALPEPEDWNAVLLKLLNSPNIGSREWIYRQYDHMVLLGTVIHPGGDAALLRVRSAAKPGVHGAAAAGTGSVRAATATDAQTGADIGIAAKIDCNARFVYLNPKRGAAIAVAEAARNCVVTGANPAAITNNLNFGNPEKPEIFWTFEQAVAGIAEACEALGTPVTGGNVSFYNETAGEAIYPTPTIGMVAVHENLNNRMTLGFQNPGDVIILLGNTKDELGGSEYLKLIHGQVAGDAPELDLAFEKKLHQAVLTAIHEGVLTAAHDVAEGGVAVALAEMAIAARPAARGCQASIFANEGRLDGNVFGESQGRIIITCNRDNVLRLRAIMIQHGIPHRLVGDTNDSGRFSLTALSPGVESEFIFRRQTLIDITIDEMTKAWKEALPQWMTTEI